MTWRWADTRWRWDKNAKQGQYERYPSDRSPGVKVDCSTRPVQSERIICWTIFDQKCSSDIAWRIQLRTIEPLDYRHGTASLTHSRPLTLGQVSRLPIINQWAIADEDMDVNSNNTVTLRLWYWALGIEASAYARKARLVHLPKTWCYI